MKRNRKSFFIIITITILTLMLYFNRHEIEFKFHVFGYDKKLYSDEYLHPTYAYLKNKKLLGIEYITNPECGQTNQKYFFDKKESLSKIIYEIDFYSEHCGNYDSIYFINRNRKEIDIFDKNGNEIKNVMLEDMITSFNTNKFKQNIRTWK